MYQIHPEKRTMRRSTGRSVKRRINVQSRENVGGTSGGLVGGFSDDDKRKLKIQIAKLSKRYYLTQKSVSCCNKFSCKLWG